MDVSVLQKKILKEIPLLSSMELQIESIDLNRSVVFVPLQPNHNHKNTAFGGSLYAACTAACYSLIYLRQVEDQIENRDLVITSGEIHYKKAVKTDFTVQAELNEHQWQSLLISLKTKKPQRLPMKCQISNETGEICCDFQGEFVLLPSGPKTL